MGKGQQGSWGVGVHKWIEREGVDGREGGDIVRTAR